MPNIIDSTVVNQTYDTSGNGGRKLVMLDNGWLVSVVYATTPTIGFYIYKSTDNGVTWQYVTKSSTNGATAANEISIVNKGNIVYITSADGQTSSKRWSLYTLDMTTTLSDPLPIAPNVFDSGQTITTSQGTSLAINESKTELHAAWSSKNATYPNSFNIRYAKGTINTDGSVIWGAVEQVTKFNLTSGTNVNYINPSIITCNGNPLVFFHQNHGVGNGYDQIKVNYKTNGIWKLGAAVNDHVGMGYTVYNGGAYVQGAPSAIFVPKSINGLANGRIWVAWHGTDSTDSAQNNIRVSYSDDGGATWSTTVKVTKGNVANRTFPTITANKSNEIFIVSINAQSGVLERYKYTGTWNAIPSLSTGNTPRFPSTLFDDSFLINFSEPVFIYQGTATTLKVGFYGTWTTTEISVPQGSIGAVADKNNLLTYSITSDGEMSEIVEKVNGVIVGTKNAVSGQELAVGLTQEQWDNVKFGKFREAPYSVNFTNKLDWQQKTISNKGIPGQLVNFSTNDYAISTGNPISPLISESSYKVGINSEYRMIIAYTNSDNITMGNSNFLNSGDTFTVPIGVVKQYVEIQSSIGSTLTTDEVDKINLTITPTADVNNTLTIEMGSEKWTYTFDKQLAPDADILSTVKAVKDSQDTYLPAVKNKIANSVRAKGGVVSGDASFEDIGNAIGSIPTGKKWASGTAAVNSATLPFNLANGTSTTSRYLEVSGLGFKPTSIRVYAQSNTTFSEYSEGFSPYAGGVIVISGNYPYGEASQVLTLFNGSTGSSYTSEQGFRIPVKGSMAATQTFKWVAYE